MKYEWKWFEELGWGMAVGGVTFIFQLLAEFDAAAIEDWKLWAITVASGLTRAVFAAGLVALARWRTAGQ